MSRAAVKSQISIYAKQKKDDIVDVIFSETAALDLSDMISDFIADRFNHLRTLFTVPQLRVVCGKVKQLSTNALADLTLSKLKNKPFQNQAQMRDFTESLEKIKEEKLEKVKHTNGNSVRISYPTKAATVEAAAVYKSTLSAEDAKSGAEGAPRLPSLATRDTALVSPPGRVAGAGAGEEGNDEIY
jgi:hypothetical protein